MAVHDSALPAVSALRLADGKALYSFASMDHLNVNLTPPCRTLRPLPAHTLHFKPHPSVRHILSGSAHRTRTLPRKLGHTHTSLSVGSLEVVMHTRQRHNELYHELNHPPSSTPPAPNAGTRLHPASGGRDAGASHLQKGRIIPPATGPLPMTSTPVTMIILSFFPEKQQKGNSAQRALRRGEGPPQSFLANHSTRFIATEPSEWKQRCEEGGDWAELKMQMERNTQGNHPLGQQRRGPVTSAAVQTQRVISEALNCRSVHCSIPGPSTKPPKRPLSPSLSPGGVQTPCLLV
ncbi:hypothetical protein ANANG_G00001200 [Anguilla anguilla]|uniref:Uncharacterized protein n=1 Tax=Anguilla anguilla TaxID=7936 RepID=A0A9D3MVT5_ANGAN|nr:hypothetical protein ANANG_G00001200 [Anguilla anguilla]